MVVDSAPQIKSTSAKFYAHLGWKVIPLHTPSNGVCSCDKGYDCNSPGKHPRTPKGLHDASNDPDVVRQWWERWPDANIGIRTGKESGLFVIDIDGECELPSVILDIPRTITGTTARGRHIYLQMPNGQTIKNKTKVGGLPIDIRGDGGYVVAPGSVHPSGIEYEWLIGPDDCELAEPSAELLAWLTATTAPARTPAARPAKPMSMTATSSSSEDDRHRKYLAKCPPAIQGNEPSGSEVLMGVLRKFVEAFKTDYETTLRAITAHYNPICVPPWSEKELRHAIDNINAKPSGPRPDTGTPASPGNEPNKKGMDSHDDRDDDDGSKAETSDVTHLTDLGNAKRLAKDHGKIIRFCFAWNKWLVWDGRRWKIDDSGYVMLLAKRTIMGLYAWAEAQLKLLANDDSPEAKVKAIRVKAVLDFTIKSQHVNRLKAMVDLVKSEPNIPISPDALDTNPWDLNCTNGTLDLRTRKLRVHTREDYITKLCPVDYNPAAICPTWLAFAGGVFAKSQTMIEYIQRLAGYWLTGETREHALPVFWGSGANGKSTLIGAIFDLMGEDYAGKASRDLLTAVKGDRHPTALAWLHGKRFAAAIESGEGARLDEALVKELTGGDTISARRMREDFWTFRPTHKIAMVTNHKPAIRGTDHGIWRRLRLIPFVVTFAENEQDKQLPEKLRAELPGILAWAVRGCTEWQRQGLADPPEVLAATAEYRTAEDRLGEFLTERCETHAEFRAKASDVYSAYKAWCDGRGERYQNATAFGMSMGERGITRDAGKRWYLGIALANPND